MRIFKISPPRRFIVGHAPVEINHVANLQMKPDELVCLLRPDGRELDIVSKNWGFYLTPSLQGRLKRNGMRAAMMRSSTSNHLFVVVVDADHLEEWQRYMTDEKQEFVMWLDEAED